MGEIGKYIYGVISSNSSMRLFVPNGYSGTEKVYPVKSLHPVRNKISNGTSQRCGSPDVTLGLTSNGVYLIPYQDISAVVSNSEIIDYMHMPKENLARLLVKHQEIIEKIMNLGYTVIPMRLGTLAVDETEVTNILHKGYSLVKVILKKINNAIETDLVATWNDFDSVLKEIGEEKEIKEFKENFLANLKGVTVDDQMKVGVMVKKALDKKRERYAFEIHNALKTVSQDCKWHELMDDKMVANFAFLIEKVNREDFDRKVEELNAKFAEKLNFRCVGPLPPYSFYTLEIKKLEFKGIDWARKKLGLPARKLAGGDNIASKDEIKRTYKAKAFSYHPDRNPEIAGIEREFDELKKAYEILADYCLATEQGGKKNKHIFDEPARQDLAGGNEFEKNAILVRVRE